MSRFTAVPAGQESGDEEGRGGDLSIYLSMSRFTAVPPGQESGDEEGRGGDLSTGVTVTSR